MSIYGKYIKGLLDLIFSFFIGIIMLPIIFFIGILLLIFQGRPIFFCQSRQGRDGKHFVMYKFRTLNRDKDSDGLTFNKSALTKIGRILRRYSLDELPQLMNVLLGDMSLVGPRPLPVAYDHLYNSEQKERFIVKPGITGWAQINGRNKISWENKLAMDVWYAHNLSFLLDIGILIKTMIQVVKSNGVFGKDGVSMPAFKGTNG